MTRSIPLVAIALFASLVFACSFSEAFEQRVIVKLFGPDGDALQGEELRYYSSPNCEGEYVRAITSEDGQTELVRQSLRGNFAVLLEQPSLCINKDGRWVVVWQDVIDPATIEVITCSLEATSAKCTRAPQYVGI